MSTQARKAVDAIIADLTDRRGLRQEWDEIDRDIQREIRETWRKLIDDAFPVSPATGGEGER